MSVRIFERYSTADEMPVLLIQGTHDPVFYWNGETDGIFSYLSQNNLLRAIIANNNCSDTPEKEYLNDKASEDRKVLKVAYKNQNYENSLETYFIEYGGHEWPSGDFKPAEVIFDFFVQF